MQKVQNHISCKINSVKLCFLCFTSVKTNFFSKFLQLKTLSGVWCMKSCHFPKYGGKWSLSIYGTCKSGHFQWTIQGTGKWLTIHSQRKSVKMLLFCRSFLSISLADHFPEPYHGKCSLSRVWYAKSGNFPCNVPTPESEHFPGYRTWKVNTFRGMVNRKWIYIRKFLCEIAPKIENILWGKIRAWGLSIHEKTRVWNYHAKVL